MRNHPFTDRLLIALLVAVAVVAVLNLTPGRPATNGNNMGRPVAKGSIDNWRTFTESGHHWGSRTPRATLLVFSDFQCPFCATFAASLAELTERYREHLLVVFRHYPIRSAHPEAFEAAIAAECAGDQGRFQPFHDAAFRDQGPIRARAWSHLAAAAGVADIAKFLSCLKEPATGKRVERDIADGQRLGVSGTPFSLLNGQILRGAVPMPVLDSVVKAMIGSSQEAGRPIAVDSGPFRRS